MGEPTTAEDGSAAEPASTSRPDRIGLPYLKELATVVPVVHILAACFYLFGYSEGFGHHIIAFMTANDVFVASLRAVGQVYLLMSLPIVLALIWRAVKDQDRANIILYVFLAAALALVLTMILQKTSSPLSGFGRREASIAFIAILLVGLLAWLIYAAGKGWLSAGWSRLNVVAGVALLFALSMAFGYNKGITDLERSHSSADHVYFSCHNAEGAQVVVRSIGSHYLALNSANSWSLVDAECQPRFRF